MDEIHTANYWEHFKFLKELSFFLPPDHPKIVQLTEVVNELARRVSGNVSDV